MFQRGPGTGYMAAKHEAIAIEPRARCQRKSAHCITGYIVSIPETGECIGTGFTSRDAWNEALDRLRARKRLVIAPDERLRTVCEPVTKFNEPLRQLIRDMRRTMLEHGGIGLAAPQVGSNLRVFVTENGVYVNPKLESCGDIHVSIEGCLSLPGVHHPVPRGAFSMITAQDEFGRQFVQHAYGLPARVWQHECDHLQGILITDYQASS